MSDTNAPEPTMEEILASIRRIISEDEPAPQASAEADTASPPHGDPMEDDILDLTDSLDDDGDEVFEQDPEPMPSAFESSGDLDIYTRPDPIPMPSVSAFVADDDEVFDDDDDALVGAPAQETASSAFGQLARTVSMPAEGRVLEDVVRELLRPMLKDWLDANLPAIVETAVQSEVERIARRR